MRSNLTINERDMSMVTRTSRRLLVWMAAMTGPISIIGCFLMTDLLWFSVISGTIATILVALLCGEVNAIGESEANN